MSLPGQEYSINFKPSSVMESFSWLSTDLTVNDAPGDKVIIKGPALFSVEKFFSKGVSLNNKKYIQDEIIRSARTLKGVGIDVNHEVSVWEELEKKGIKAGVKPRLKGHVLYGEEEDGVLEYLAEVNDRVYAQKIRDTVKVRKNLLSEKEYFAKWGKKPLLGVSVDAEFLHLQCCKCGAKFTDFNAYEKHMKTTELIQNFSFEPHQIYFKRLSLVEPPEKPGVIGANFDVVETDQKGFDRLIETLLQESNPVAIIPEIINNSNLKTKIKEGEKHMEKTSNETSNTNNLKEKLQELTENKNDNNFNITMMSALDSKIAKLTETLTVQSNLSIEQEAKINAFQTTIESLTDSLNKVNENFAKLTEETKIVKEAYEANLAAYKKDLAEYWQPLKAKMTEQENELLTAKESLKKMQIAKENAEDKLKESAQFKGHEKPFKPINSTPNFTYNPTGSP